MMRRSLVDKGFVYDENCLHCEDYDLWIRLAKAGYRLENLAEPLLFYRVHEGGVSLQNRALQLQNSHKIFQKHYPEVNLTYPEYCGLVGAGSGLGWRRRMELLRGIFLGQPVSAGQVLRQLLLHFRSIFFKK
jgi:GT2 family glycosyltransferase